MHPNVESRFFLSKLARKMMTEQGDDGSIITVIGRHPSFVTG